MKKLNKILSVFLTFALICGCGAVVASAATGDSVITVVKNIVDKWFVNGEEVTEAEYAEAMEVQYEDYIIEHHLNTGVQYEINGVVVTEEEALAYIANNGATTPEIKNNTKPLGKSITFTASDLTGLNAGSLGDYLTFEEDGYGNVMGAKIKSDKVTAATYKYNENTYITYTTHSDDKYVYTETSYGVIYQDAEEGMVFNFGQTSEVGFYVCDDNFENTLDVTAGDYLYKFNAAAHTITFNEVFESITLYITD